MAGVSWRRFCGCEKGSGCPKLTGRVTRINGPKSNERAGDGFPRVWYGSIEWRELRLCFPIINGIALLMPTKPFHVGVVQMRCSADRDDNMKRALGFVREAAGRGANVVCLPELFLGPYFCQTEDHAHFDLAEPIPGPSTHELGALAGELGITIVGSLFERRAAGVYHNTATVHDADGRMVGVYRKMHIPDDPLYYEKFYFTPGDLGFHAFETKHANVGTLVCWDQWYPEAARLTALRGADVIFYPTAIGWHPAEKAEYGEAQYDAWQTMQRAHAISNGVYVAAVNRIGHEGEAGGGIEFWGGSFVVDPFGRVLARSERRQGGSAGGEVRPRVGRNHAAALAVFEGQADRRLWPDYTAVFGAGLMEQRVVHRGLSFGRSCPHARNRFVKDFPLTV